MFKLPTTVLLSFLVMACGRRTSTTCGSAATLAHVELRTDDGRAVDAKLVERLAAARPFDCEVSDKPDARLTDASGTTRVSIFVAKEFFVLGEYLDAWTAAMQDRPYCCYTLDRADAKALAGM